MHFYLRW